MQLTKPQQQSLYRAYQRRTEGSDNWYWESLSYLQFRRTVQSYDNDTAIVHIPWANYWLGIESDGYAHS
jgi:hypothetical protein